MKVVGIIAEYNPFHLGHKYQIEKIREEFGEDTAIVALMSGNFTQRGELAITDKLQRAKCAVESGINLVLELPFPFSMSAADYFARASISIFNRLGFIDYLSFGSESGNIDELSSIAKLMLSKEYNAKFKEISDTKLGYAKKCELALASIEPSFSLSFTPNNILAIEYLKALNKSKSSILPHTLKRSGANYDSEILRENENPSAMAIRTKLSFSGDIEEIRDFLPDSLIDIIKDAIKNGDMPTDTERLSSALISYFRMNPKATSEYLECDSGLYNRLYKASLEADSISSLLKLSETKKYTNAKIRRAMWYAFFGVTSSDMNAMPAYTQLLALDKVGMSLLHSSQDSSAISILTKPSALKKLTPRELYFKSLSDKADSVYELSKPIPKRGNSSMTLTPYVKK